MAFPPNRHFPTEKRLPPPPSFYSSMPTLHTKVEFFVQGLPNIVRKDWDRLGKEMMNLYIKSGNSTTNERADGRDIAVKEVQQKCAREIRELNNALFSDVPNNWAECALRAAEVHYRRKAQKRMQRTSLKRCEKAQKRTQVSSKGSRGDNQKTSHTVLQDEFPRITRHDLQILQSIRDTPLWAGLISPELVKSLTSLDIALMEGAHPLWTDRLPEMSNEKTPTEATLTMWTTRLLDSSAITDIYVKRGNVGTNVDEEKRSWAQLCLAQIGARSIAEPLYALAHIILSEADPVEPLSHWTAKKPSQLQHPRLGIEVMITPTGGFTDIHADSTTVGRAICVDRCEKFWVMWPPTTHNLDLWAANKGLSSALLRYGAQLEGGLVVHTAGSAQFNAVTMPAGTLHCAFTIVGGFLSGITYMTAEDIQLAGAMLELQVQRSQDEDQILADCTWFISAAREILLSRPNFSLQCLTSMARLMRKIVSLKKEQHQAWKPFHIAATKLFYNFRKHNPICPCGKDLPPKCGSHFVEDSHAVFDVVPAPHI